MICPCIYLFEGPSPTKKEGREEKKIHIIFVAVLYNNLIYIAPFQGDTIRNSIYRYGNSITILINALRCNTTPAYMR